MYLHRIDINVEHTQYKAQRMKPTVFCIKHGLHKIALQCAGRVPTALDLLDAKYRHLWAAEVAAQMAVFAFCEFISFSFLFLDFSCTEYFVQVIQCDSGSNCSRLHVPCDISTGSVARLLDCRSF